ncbi:MAG: aminotransferase class I/II-fold pyridoxal phosphate-dependent enzyme [Parachlamydiales bacterium]|nr:aminotransferase class I/II-fold pyridoxal phosphate-dependent enzyme [Parachlamydiales bacterium]
MKPSATGAINAKAEELRRKGRRIYNFAKGDPVLPNHPLLIDAAKKALGESPYAPIAGLTELRKAAADWMNKRYGSTFKEAQTVVTNGGKFGIYAALQVLLEPGDEVIIQAPYWVSYPEMVLLAKGKPVIVQTRWKLTPELLKQAITSKTKVLILNNGCNPTGILYSQSEMDALLRVADEAKIWIISDEVYSEIVFDGAKYISCATHSDRTIIIESCSKNFAMAGWRVGFAFGPKEIIDKIIALQSQSTTGTSYISQKVAIAALENSKIVADYVREALAKRRKLFFDLLGKEAPPAGIYYFAKMGNCEEILEKTGVALVPGEAFGAPGYARFSFAETEEEIKKGLHALEKIV